MDESDPELLSTYLRDHSQQAFARLVERHIDLVFATALRVLHGDCAQAEDVTQEVFVRLARHAPALRDTPVLSGWLYTTAHHTAVSAIRSAVRRRQREAEASTMHQLHTDDTIAWTQIRPLIDEAMHQLPPTDQNAVLLRFFEGKSFALIGERLGLSENAARMRVERALDKLNGLLRQRGIGSTSAVLSGLLLRHTAIAAPAGLAASVGAVASAAGSASAATFVILTFMSSLRTSIGLGAAAIAAIGFGLWQTQRLEEAGRKLTALQTEQAAAAQAAKNEAAAILASHATIAPSPVIDPMRTAQEEARRKAEYAKASAKAQIEAGTSPEILQQRLKAFRFAASLHFSALYKALNLSATQVGDFEKLMEDRYWALADVTASALTQELSRFDRPFLDLRRQAFGPTEEKLRTLLGESGYRAYADYEAHDLGRTLAGRLNGDLSLAGLSLSPEQLNELARVFTQHAAEAPPQSQSWMDASLLGFTPARLAVTDVYWDHVAPKLPAFLSAEQVQALNGIYVQAQLAAKADRDTKKQIESLLAAHRKI